MNSSRLMMATSACLVALALPPLVAQAATKGRLLWHAASAVCDTTNPELDTSIRRRVNEFKNIGAEGIAITCGTMTDTLVADNDFTEIVVYLQNTTATAGSVGCTINAGTAQDTLYTNKKTVAIAAGAVGNLSWAPGDYGSTRKHATLSCSLPPGWSIRDLVVSYNEDVGE